MVNVLQELDGSTVCIFAAERKLVISGSSCLQRLHLAGSGQISVKPHGELGGVSNFIIAIRRTPPRQPRERERKLMQHRLPTFKVSRVVLVEGPMRSRQRMACAK